MRQVKPTSKSSKRIEIRRSKRSWRRWIDAAKKIAELEAIASDCRTESTSLLKEKNLPAYKYKGYLAKYKAGGDTTELKKPNKK